MNLLDLYEQREPYQQAIDQLEQRRIDTLNDRMQDLLSRAKTASADAKAALKREYEKIKAERDSYYQVREAQRGQDVVDRDAKMKALTPSKPGMKGAVQDVAQGLKNFLQGRPETGPTYEADQKKSLDLSKGVIPTEPLPEAGGGWALDPKTKLELKQRRDRQKTIARHAGRPGSSTSAYERRVAELEAQGLTRSDAQGVADAEEMQGKLQEHGGGIGPRQHWQDLMQEEQIIEGIRDTASATAVIACLLTGGSLTGCATAPQKTSAQQVLKTGQDLGRTVQAAKRITGASVQAEVQQEIRNLARGLGNQPQELNNSNILRIWKQIKGAPPVPKEPPAPEYGPADPVRRMPVSEDNASAAAEEAILKRIMVAHTDLLQQFGPAKVMQAAEEVAYNVGDVGEIGSSDVSGWVRQVEHILGARP